MKNIFREKRMIFGRFLTAFAAVFALCFFYMVTGETVLAEEEAIELGKRVYDVLEGDNAMDQYVLTAKDYTFSYRFELSTYDTSSAQKKDVMVAVYDEAGNKLGERSDWENIDELPEEEYLEIPRCKPGKYYVRVTAASTERIEYGLIVQKANNYGKVRLSKTTAVYNGKKQKLPAVAVYDAAGKKIDKSEYTYWFGRTSDKTKYRKNVSGIGEYTLYLYYGREYYEPYTDDILEYQQRVFRAFVMKPERAEIKSKSTRNGKITVNCKVSQNAEWYIWELAEDKQFKHIVKREYWGKPKEVFRGLKKGKNYYIRVYIESKDKRGRTYINPIRGAYSKPVRVKCK